MPTPIETEVSARSGIGVERLLEIKRRRALDDRVLAEIPQDLLRGLDQRLELPNLPLARAHYLALRHRNADGGLPGPRALWETREAAFRLRGATPPRTAGGMRPGPAPLTAAATWSERGPGNIGGRTRAIVPHPTTPQIIYAGSVGGGIWQTVDSG
jgi:hypothetical protein